MIKKLLCGILFCFNFSVSAQSVEWVNTPDITLATQIPSGYISATNLSGEVYFAGFKDNPFSYTELFGNLVFQKYSQSGDLLFTKTLSDRAVVHQLQSDSQGNMFMAVEYLNTLTFDNFSVPNTTGLPEHMLLKFNAEGELLWHKVLTMDVVGVSTFKSIAFDSNGHIYIGYDNYGTCQIEKLNANGDSLQLIVQENVNRLTSLAVDSDGNIYATGSCANTNSVYAGALQPTDLDYTVYLVKYSPEGVFQWIKYVQDITCSSPMVQIDANNNIYWAAETFISVQLDTITTEGPINGVDFFLAKLNTNGDYLWAKELPGNGSLEVAHHNFLQLDDFGSLYLTGTLSGGTTQWSEQVSTSTGTFSNREVVLLRYFDNGAIDFAFTAGGTQSDSAQSLSVDAAGNAYLTGMMQGTAQMQWFSFTHPQPMGYTPFLARISPVSLSINQQEKNIVRIYPNPVTDFLTVQTSETIVNITVFSLNGQRMQLPQNGNQLDFSGVANGVYVVEVVMENGLERVKVVR